MQISSIQIGWKEAIYEEAMCRDKRRRGVFGEDFPAPKLEREREKNQIKSNQNLGTSYVNP